MIVLRQTLVKNWMAAIVWKQDEERNLRKMKPFCEAGDGPLAASEADSPGDIITLIRNYRVIAAP